MRDEASLEVSFRPDAIQSSYARQITDKFLCGTLESPRPVHRSFKTPPSWLGEDEWIANAFSQMKPKLVIILGPTGVGKSEVAVDVALGVGGEIINADSQQVYRAMDIGTGKPTPEKRQKLPHNLIDIVDPDEEFNVALFREKALKSAEAIWSRGKKVVVCGGTGLYIKALTHGLFVGPAKNPEIRKRLE